MIKIHPRVGYDILNELEVPHPVAQIVLQHHIEILQSTIFDFLHFM